MRYVICEAGPQQNEWALPPATFLPAPWIAGGTRSLYELAAAIACTGREVELRGSLNRQALEQITGHLGVDIHLPDEERRPDADDVVFVTDGLREPLWHGRTILSSARMVLLAFGPSGANGWSFIDAWEPPDFLTLDPESVARPEHYREMHALDVHLWTNSRATRATVEAAGVPCRFIGRGQPLPWPDVPGKSVDVAVVSDNRWASLAEDVAAELPDASIVRIERGMRDDLLRHLATARVLIWPSRLEGHSRIQCEARAMGTVPVALPNPFADGLDEGGVIVPTLADIAPRIRELLADEARRDELARTGRASARDSENWHGYVETIDSALRDLPARRRVGGIALSSIGAQVQERIVSPSPQAEARVVELEHHAVHMSDVVRSLQERSSSDERADRAEARVAELEQHAVYMSNVVEALEERLRVAGAQAGT